MSSMPVLTYFNGRGRAEVARWIFAAAGVEYEDKRMADGWQELKPNTPTGQLPMVTIDGEDIAQSGAICHYLATKYGLNGSNDMEAALIHMVWDCMEDFISAMIKFMFSKNPEEKAELKKAFMETQVPKTFSILKKRLGGKEWLVGDKMTLADLSAVAVLSTFQLSDPSGVADLMKTEPEISKLVEKVTSNAGIKKWIEMRPETSF